MNFDEWMAEVERLMDSEPDAMIFHLYFEQHMTPEEAVEAESYNG